MKVFFTANFKRKYQRLPAPIKELTNRQMEILLRSPRHPALRLKKMNDPRDICVVLSEFQVCRFSLQFQGDRCILRNIGITMI